MNIFTEDNVTTNLNGIHMYKEHLNARLTDFMVRNKDGKFRYAYDVELFTLASNEELASKVPVFVVSYTPKSVREIKGNQLNQSSYDLSLFVVADEEQPNTFNQLDINVFLNDIDDYTAEEQDETIVENGMKVIRHVHTNWIISMGEMVSSKLFCKLQNEFPLGKFLMVYSPNKDSFGTEMRVSNDLEFAHELPWLLTRQDPKKLKVFSTVNSLNDTPVDYFGFKTLNLQHDGIFHYSFTYKLKDTTERTLSTGTLQDVQNYFEMQFDRVHDLKLDFVMHIDSKYTTPNFSFFLPYSLKDIDKVVKIATESLTEQVTSYML